MKPKMIAKLAVDILMTVLLLLLMGYQFWGEAAHEWIGAGMFVLFLAHHLLNLNWHKNIFKGKYTAFRTLILCVDAMIWVSMLAQMYSGIVMSRYVFSFLSIEEGLCVFIAHYGSKLWKAKKKNRVTPSSYIFTALSP